MIRIEDKPDGLYVNGELLTDISKLSVQEQVAVVNYIKAKERAGILEDVMRDDEELGLYIS